MYKKNKNINSCNLEKFDNFDKINERFPINNFNEKTGSFNIPNLIDHAEYYLIKPKGRKAYLWFTYYKKDLLCLLIFINNHKNICDESNEFYKFNIEYDNTLCYNNVLLIGTYFYKFNIINNNQNDNQNDNQNVRHYFILDNVLNFNIYNNMLKKNFCNELFKFKLNLYKNVMQKIKNSNFNVNLGIILDNYDELFKIIYKLNYQIYCISCFNNKKYLGNFIIDNNLFNNNNNLGKDVKINFKITACINQDLYNLYVLENNKEIFYDYALINSYKTSIFMNKLFRKIKENNNLDLLEESDDEEEFENINLDKYVDLSKKYVMKCEYCFSLKKWVPIEKGNFKISNKKNILLLEKNPTI